MTKDERAEIARINGRKSKGPKNPNRLSLMDRNPDEFKKRFFSKIIHSESECWVWTGAKFKSGYGRINSGGKMRIASRVSYELFIGKIPDGAHILHSCDNPSCVNPNHLRAGTAYENIRDCITRNRINRPKGEDAYQAKLTVDIVRKLRNDPENYTKCYNVRMGKKYGVDPRTIAHAISGRSWKIANEK